MAIPVARVHLKVAHAALPALLPTPPKCKKLLPLLPAPCAAAILPKPPGPAKAKPSRADTDERWDAHKVKPAACSPSTSASSSPGPRSANSVRSSGAGHGSSSSLRKIATTTSSPPPKPAGRADCVERWDAHKKKVGSPASSSSSSSSSSVSCSLASRSISRTSAERWDLHKKPRPPPQAKALDDGESSTTGSNVDMDIEEEEIVWKPRAMYYAGSGFAVAAPQPSMLPVPTAFLVPVA